jgi:membrane protease YdiL (CAAX protease family)
MQGNPESPLPETSSTPPEDLLPASTPQVSPPLRPAPPLVPREIWTLRDLLLFVAFLPFAFLAANLLGFTAYVVLRPFAGWHARADLLPSNTFFSLILQSVFYVFVLGYLFLLARLLHHQPLWKSVGWRMPTGRQVLGYLAGGGGLAIIVSILLSLVPDTHGFPLERLFTSSAASYAIGAFAIGIAPLVEELVFRGLLFAIFERSVGMPFAVFSTAVLFAGLHVPEYWHAWNHVGMILIVGMVFSVARGVSGTITPSIFLHVGYNSLIMTGLFLSTQHFRAIHALVERG